MPSRRARFAVAFMVAVLALAWVWLPAGVGQADTAPLFSPYRVPAEALALKAGADGHRPVYLVLNVGVCRLYVYQDGNLLRSYPTAVGRIHTPTPVGRYRIITKHINPTWYPDDRPPIPPGPDNPLGTRWMGFTMRGHGLHGNNAPWIIGSPGSSGCVRMLNEDAEELFELVRIGTQVEVVYEPVEITVPANPIPAEADAIPDDAPAPPARPPFIISLSSDIYQRVGPYRTYLEERLAQAGLILTSAELGGLMQALWTHGAVTWDTATRVTLGGQALPTDVVHVGKGVAHQPRIQVRAFGEALGLAVAWNSELGLPTLNARPVEETAVVGGRAYAAVDDLARATGLNLEWDWVWLAPEADSDLVRCELAIARGLTVWVGGQLASVQAFQDEGGTYLPLRDVAEAIGLSVAWDPVRRVALLSGLEVPEVRLIDGRSYVRVEALRALLDGWFTIEVSGQDVFITR